MSITIYQSKIKILLVRNKTYFYAIYSEFVGKRLHQTGAGGKLPAGHFPGDARHRGRAEDPFFGPSRELHTGELLTSDLRVLLRTVRTKRN